jgi:hypothetical protein
MGRLTNALAALPMGQFGRPNGEAGSEHDYITFPETKEPPRPNRERKAA